MVSAEAVRKPNSVPEPGYPCPGNDHSSKDSDCPESHATYPGAWAGHPQALPYLVLHRMGFTKLPRSPGELVRSYRTFSPLPRMRYRIPRRYIFCCTFLHVAATPRYGASCPAVFGLSSRQFLPSSDRLDCFDRYFLIFEDSSRQAAGNALAIAVHIIIPSSR